MAGTTQLPPGCTGANCATAIANGNYPYVFNNDTVDGSFGVTSPLYLKQITPSGLPAGRHPGADERADHQLLVEVGGRAQPVERRQVPDVHGLRGRARHGRRVERQHPRRHRPDQPGPRRVLPRGREPVGQRQVHLHRDQRLQRQQRPGGGRGERRRQGLLLHGGQRGQRRQPAADRRRPRRGHADHHPVRPAGGGPDARPAHPGRQLQRHPARRQGGQGRQGRQLPRPRAVQQRAVLHQGQRRQRRRHRLLPRHHRHRLPGRRRPARSRARSCRPPGSSRP